MKTSMTKSEAALIDRYERIKEIVLNEQSATSCEHTKLKSFDMIEEIIAEEYEKTSNAFDWEEFKQEKIIVHCNSKDEAKSFCKEASKQNIFWGNGKNPASLTNWEENISSELFYGYSKPTHGVPGGLVFSAFAEAFTTHMAWPPKQIEWGNLMVRKGRPAQENEIELD